MNVLHRWPCGVHREGRFEDMRQRDDSFFKLRLEGSRETTGWCRKQDWFRLVGYGLFNNPRGAQY